jgi:hypothetical protein
MVFDSFKYDMIALMTFQNMFKSWKLTYAIISNVCFNQIKKQMHTYNLIM